MRAGIVLLASLGACAASAGGVAPADREFVEEWLMRDCYVGEAHGADDILRAKGSGTEPAFRLALPGPPAAALLAVEDEAGREYDEMRELLRDPADAGFSPHQARIVLDVSRQEYVAMETGRFALRWQIGAIRGLGLIGTSSSLPDLAAISKSPGPLRDDALKASARIRERFPGAP